MHYNCMHGHHGLSSTLIKFAQLLVQYKSLPLHTSTHNSKFEIHGEAQIKSMEQPGLTHLACTFLL